MAVIAIAFAVVGNIIASSVTYVFKIIVNAATALEKGGSFDAIIWGSAMYIGLLAVAKLCWRLGGFASAVWSMNAMATARYALTSYVTLHSRAYFSDRFAGSIMTKIRHASAGMRDIVDIFLWDFLEVIVSVLACFVITFSVSPVVAYIFFVWVVVIVVVNFYLVRKRVPLTVRAHNLETALNGATVDLLTNVGAMQEYARREFEIERLKTATDERRKAGLKNWRSGELMRVINSIILVFFGGAMVFTIVSLAQAGVVSVGDIVLVITIILRIEGLLQSLGSNFNHFAEIWGEVSESLEEIIEPHEIVDQKEARVLHVENAQIDFKDASFAYPSQQGAVLKDFQLHIKGREKIGLVGKSGAGKSTLIKLLLRHYELDSGAIQIDNQNIYEVTQDSLRETVAVVPQEPLLFHRTLKENIAYGNPAASEEQIVEAAKLAQAYDFISALPAGYETTVGERGVKLSGGERQRVAIARAILKNAPILVLDEATASLDSESEVAIQKALHELMQGKTVIAIAHRLSTLREMDRIIVLDQGQIAEEGTHDELIKKGGIYAELWKHQAGGFLQDE